MQQQPTIDFKRYLKVVLKYWYLVVLGGLLGFGYGYFQNKYTPKVFRVSATMLVKDNSSNGNSASILFNNPLFAGGRNYYDDPYLLKAEPLIGQVVKELNFTSTYYVVGDLLTSELYPGPKLVFRDSKGDNSNFVIGNFWIKIKDKDQFYLAPYSEEIPDFGKTNAVQKFGQPFSIQGTNLIIERAPDFYLSNLYKQPLLLKLNKPEILASSFSNKLQVDWESEGSGLLKLSMTGNTPAKLIDFLQSLSQNYIAQNLAEKNINATNTISFINSQLKNIGDSLNLFEDQLQNFKVNNLGGNLAAQTSQLFDQLKNLEEERSAQLVVFSYYNYLKEYIKDNQADNSGLVVPSTLGISDPVLNQLVSSLLALQQQQQELKLSTGTAESPYRSDFNKRVATLKSNILEVVNNLDAQQKLNQQALDSRLRKLEQELRSIPKSERELINIQRFYQISESLYNYLLEKQAEASISKASNTPDIKLVNPPKQEGGAIAPNVDGNYKKYVGIGLALPLGLLFALYYFNNKVQYLEDVSLNTQVPLAGTVGHYNPAGNLVLFEKPKSAISESFRSLRSNINFLTAKNSNQHQTLLITSSISGEGKTFCSINLASVYAISGKKTVLIGADLRKPKIYQDFNLTNDNGLSNYLAGHVGQEIIIQSTEFDNLDVISGGPIPPNPSELLLASRMEELMKNLKQHYDIIIVDSAPLGLVSDAQVLLPLVDQCLFIVRHKYTRLPMLRNIQKLVDEGILENTSIVYNDLKNKGIGGYYSYGYGYGYGYYEEDNQPKTTLGKLANKIRRRS